MQMNPKQISISIVGSGNVATRLCYAFQDAGVKVLQLLSASDSGKKLAEFFGIERVENPSELMPADVVLLCIKDDALTPEYIMQFPDNILLCHSSGSVSMDVFGKRIHAGVFYPLQTFSKIREVEFENIPVCLEARDSQDLVVLKQLASTISNDVRIITSAERKKIHLAAIFVSNFANHLYKIAKDLLEENQIDFDILKPLIMETAAKVQEMNPAQAQTGPALRNDNKIIEEHLELLTHKPDYQYIYKIISKSIAENN